MPTTPGDLLAVAHVLAGRDDEASWRAAIHQAYYAVYHAACEALGLDPVTRYREEARHGDVLRTLTRTPMVSPRLTRMKRFMPRLRELRVTADYNLGAAFTQRQARDAVADADYVLKAAHRP